MYSLATMNGFTDRDTDGETEEQTQTDDSIVPIADHAAWHYDRLKVVNIWRRYGHWTVQIILFSLFLYCRMFLCLFLDSQCI